MLSHYAGLFRLNIQLLGICNAVACVDGSGVFDENDSGTDTGAVSTLPTTGVADNAAGLNPLLGAGHAAGAAAFLAGRKLREEDQTVARSE